MLAALAACAAAPEQAVSSGTTPKKPTAKTVAVPLASASAPIATAPPGSNGSASSAASKLPSYAELIKDFTRLPGWLNIYKKDERYLLELKESDFAQPFFFTTQRSRGIGERWLWSGMMLESGIGKFVRLSDRVQWIERNAGFVASSKPMQFAVADAYSDSLRGGAAILSQPHPSSRAILVDLNALLLTDFSASVAQLQSTYRQPYQFDRANSLIQQVRSNSEETVVELLSHYAAASLAVPTPGQAVQPSTPGTLPDARSMFLGFAVSFSPLPTEMAGRPADARVGYFRSQRYNYDRNLAPHPREYVIKRWRLEKKDPAAPLSEPVKPITYWLDRNIPEQYRDTVREAILSWNTAFERAGFKDAIRVEQQADDAPWRSASRQHATVQWLLGTDASASIGPSLVDPRSGEILDADIVISDFRPRGARRAALYDFPRKAHTHEHDEPCDFAEASFADLAQALELAAARGEIEPDGPEAEALAKDVLRWVVMHEVGHTLGLTHNFRASSAYTLAQLRDPAFVERNGLAPSVMDYTPLNQHPASAGKVALTQKTLGPYDLWAIEYGYTPLPREEERAQLRKIAGRAENDPLLSYGDDFDAGSFDGNVLSAGIDPAVARYDLGNDPVAWFRLRLQLARELWDALAKHPPSGREEEARETRAAVNSSLSQLGMAASNAARNIGGVSISRHTSPARRDVFTPLPASVQRATLAALSQGLFQPASFQIEPALLRRLAPDYFEPLSLEPQPSIGASVLRQQSTVLDLLFSDRVSQRLLEAELLVSDRFSLAELHATLRQDIWQELRAGTDIPQQRRALQRAHLSRLSNLILRGSGASSGATGTAPADVRALARHEASALQLALRTALPQGGRSVEARAHLQESLATLDEALHAPLLRTQP
ncbi:zinc-dependent metalloprotease [Uliginosibacterium sp. TH139]|uniref:zinc-dependent metalloprotease n=1 Tax=Uliginosibacterium sp. TH139 TaxID=2067453 RepID=UPI000C7A7AD3|nr:zinc-dependent metalloprotease [Uliginosibacterium sp. TH139]PLK48046.1 metallopeptidase [Uliginosibacterium sp. TH139]